MKNSVVSSVLAVLICGVIFTSTVAHAQTSTKKSAELSNTLSRLANNPKYQGRVIGTHLRRSDSGYLYEIRILRPNDSVIVVLVNPQTGRVIRDSERKNGRSNTLPKKKN